MQTINVSRTDYNKSPKQVAEHEGITVHAGLFENTGVPYLLIANNRGEIRMLPYRGPQIWSAHLDDKDLQMESVRTEPRNIVVSSDPEERMHQFLSEYGALYVPCGVLTMGCPDDPKTEFLHGRHPMANCKDAIIGKGSDENGPWIEIRSKSDDPTMQGPEHDYVTLSRNRVYLDRALVYNSLTTGNKMPTAMDYMFLAHVNLRKVDGGTLIYAPGLENLRVRQKDPDHIGGLPPEVQENYHRLKRMFTEQPELHRKIDLGQKLYPEIVLYGEQAKLGQALMGQVLPDLSAHVSMYDPSKLPQAIIWMRDATPEQADDEGFSPTNSLGLIFATGLPEGKNDARARGEVLSVPKMRTDHAVFGLMNEVELRDRVKDLDELLRV